MRGNQKFSSILLKGGKLECVDAKTDKKDLLQPEK